MRTRQHALIFDFGNVIAYFDYARACESLGRKLGLSGEDFLERLRARGLMTVLQEYERGAINSVEFGRAVGSLAGVEIPFVEFSAAWSDIFWLNEPVGAVVRDLKASGYTLVLGSNTNDLHAAQFRGQFAETLAHFDRLVLSYEVGHIKPAAEFFHACAEAAKRPPGDCVFIDDMLENVEGARAAGLIGLQFRDVPYLLEELRGLGIAMATDVVQRQPVNPSPSS